MGHAISAIVSRSEADQQSLAQLGLRMITLPQGFVLLPLTAELVDSWSVAHVDEVDDGHRPLLDCAEVRDVGRRIFGDKPFAIIETDYFGGVGDQAAVAYAEGVPIMAAEEAELGPINRALKLLGAFVGSARDEFDALGMGRYRSWQDDS